MKNRGLFTLLGSICLVFILAAPTLGQVIKLRYAEQNPPTAWSSIQCVEPWVKKVEEATKGRVKIDVYYGQTLARGSDMWNAVKSGVVDMGWCFHGYWPDMTPLSDVITLPGLPFKTGEKGSEVLWKLYEKYPEIQKEFKDVHPLLVFANAPYTLVTTKKQVKTLEDLKGMKIRVTGGPPTDQIKALGAVPVLIPMPDLYQALEKGVVDGAAVPWNAILSLRFYEIAKYYTDVPFSSVYFSICMNKQIWERLPKDVQEAITSVSALEGSKFWGRNFCDTAEQGTIDLLKKENRTINKYTLPQQESDRWNKVAGDPLWKEWVTKMERKGHPKAQQILNSAVEMLKK